MAIDIVMRLVGTDAGAGQMLKGATREATALDRMMAKVTKNNMGAVNKSVAGLGGSLKTAEQQAAKLDAVMQRARNWSIGLAAAGAAGLVLTNHLTNSFVEADRLGGRLESLMKGKGLEAGIDQVKKLGNEIAGLTGGDDDEVAAAIAGAIASGRVQGLRQYGIAIDATGQAAIAAAGKISIQAKTQETFNQVMRAGGDAVKNLKEGMDASTIALGEMGVRWGNIEEQMGKGSAIVKAALYANVLDPIYTILEANPGLQTTAGGVLAIGSAGVTAAGGALALTSQIGMATLGLKTMGITGVTSFNAITAASMRTMVVIGKIGLVALVAAGAMYALWKAYSWKENKELQANIAKGDPAARKRYDLEVKTWQKRGQPIKSYEEWAGNPNEDDIGDTEAQAAKLEKQQERMDALMTKMNTIPVVQAEAAALLVAAPAASLPAATGAPKRAPKARRAKAPRIMKNQGDPNSPNGLKQDDEYYMALGIDPDALRAQAGTEATGIQGGKRGAGVVGNAMALLMGGGGLAALGTGAGGGATGIGLGGGASSTKQHFALSDKDFTKRTLPNGDIEVTFSGRFTIGDRMAKAAQAFAK